MHSTHQNCGTPQALCTPRMKIADSLRLCAAPHHQKCGTSQALRTPMIKLAERLRPCAPPPHEKGGASQALCTPMMKIADCRRLSALFVHTTHETCGTLQALCTPMMKPPSVSGFECSAHENCGASQAACSPMIQFTKIVGRLRLCAPPSRSRLQSQALGTFGALHSPKLREASGFLHPHDLSRPAALRDPKNSKPGNNSAKK